MIDLHIQTLLGDGDMSIFRLLESIDEKELEYFSIVDVNHALAYRLIDLEAYPNIIPAARFNTFFNGRMIDLIGYDIDVEAINAWYEAKYPIEKIEEIEKERTNFLRKQLFKQGYEIFVDDFRYDKLGVGASQIIDQLNVNYPDYKYKNARDFKNYETNNPKSDLYLEDKNIYLEIDQVIELIRAHGGKVFLAHPFEYRMDVTELLEMFVQKDFDGLEVFHASASQVKSMRLLELCKMTNKLASLGSGFVGNDQHIPLGVYIDNELLKLDCFKWIFERGIAND
ncbi:MAG: hypothetical protein GX074_02035 [Erysipelothrix sp.]|nr:hypothetical protein [Erysipelothrix sp.]